MEGLVVKQRLIGKGSYGKVYVAKYRNGGRRQLAVKSAVCSSLSSFLLREEEIIRYLGPSCPYVIQCYGGYYSRSWVYNLILEYAPGGTLNNLMMRRRGGKLPESEVREYARMIARGLRYMHEKGVVHCDLKPDNVLVCSGENGVRVVKIADFGLAKIVDGEEEEEEVEEEEEEEEEAPPRVGFRGTPAYMSPESLALGQHGPAMDIWSFGCTVISMVTGKSVWADCNSGDEIFKLVVVEKRVPEIPEFLSQSGKDFLGKCFERDPRMRWTAEMLLNHPFLLMAEFPSSFTYCSWGEGEFSSVGRSLISLLPTTFEKRSILPLLSILFLVLGVALILGFFVTHQF